MQVVFKKGLEANLPSSGGINELFFCIDTGRLFQGNGAGNPMTEYSNIRSGYVDLTDLQNKNPRIIGKLYLTNDAKLYIYNGVEYVEISGKSDETPSIEVKQITKLNVIATPENPHIVEIPIEFTSKFDKLPIEVLRMEGIEGQTTQTLAEFNNGDETDFESNEFIEFDGTMHLKTNYEFETEVVDEIEGIYSFDLGKLRDFKKIVSIECR